MSNRSLVYGSARRVCEWCFESTRVYVDPFNEIELDVLVTNETGASWRVPAFWVGGSKWRVRFAAPAEGTYHFNTICTQIDDVDLHDVRGKLEIAPYEGTNPLLDHGRLGLSADRRHFSFEDGIPFFWLGDTWWMAFSSRMRWPEMVEALAEDRVQKGFTVIQLVAGLFPDMDWGDERGANAAGLPYNADLTEINPAYFDEADVKISYLVEAGLMPCIVGCWGYFFNWVGHGKIRKHWRYLIARWSAYPVVWCLAGEATYAYHMSKTPEQDALEQKTGWAEIGRYVRLTDPMHRLVTIHPIDCGRDNISDDSVLDFEMLQTFHLDHESIPISARVMKKEWQRTPIMPVLNAEVNYEGIMGGCYDNVQRAVFWISMLSGAAGHTYGANGIWQVNEQGRPYGPSSHDTNWGNRPWDEAMRLPGSGQLGIGKAVLERYPWWEFMPRQEWVEPRADEENPWQNYAAGIPGRVRVIYIPRPVFWGQNITICGIEADTRYAAKLINPSTGEETLLSVVEPDEEQRWALPPLPEMRDWILVLEGQDVEELHY
jgi:hypothetical protein